MNTFDSNSKRPTPSSTTDPNALASRPSLEDHATDGPLWVFDALDTWFLRESRPMNSVGGAELKSTFPPPARTVVGAIRSAIGESYNVSWTDYPHQPEHADLHALIGDSEHLGRLSFKGPFLMKNGQRLYPAPLILLKSNAHFTRLLPSKEVTQCDLGHVQLPIKRDPHIPGAKPLESAWLTQAGFEAVMQDAPLDATHIIYPKDVFDDEERLGIGRNNATRTTGDGLLYQTRHVRPKQDIAIGMVVQGLTAKDNVPVSGMVRLGAEGRLAHWRRIRQPEQQHSLVGTRRLLVTLLTHAHFQNGWIPDGFASVTLPNGQTVWDGTLHGVQLRVLCAVIGKPVREGGWDMAQRQPRAMTSLVPAGSCYFCEVLDGHEDAASKLNGQHIGYDQNHGRGEIAVGIWNH